MNGHLFKPGTGIIHDVGTDDTDFKLAVITNIYVVNQFLKLTCWKFLHIIITSEHIP